MEKKVIKTYKGFNKDLTCRGFQYEIGKEYSQEGEVSVCNRGFHACKNPLDVLDYYNEIDNRFCEVEQSGSVDSDGSKTASSKIKIKAEIGWTGLFKAGIEYLKEITNPEKVKNNTDGLSDKGGDSAKIGSSGYSAQIGSSGDSAQIDSTGEDSVICCAGINSVVKAKQGSWITLAEWVLNDTKGRYVPKCVKTEFVDGKLIKADTWYKLVDGEFKEVV